MNREKSTKLKSLINKVPPGYLVDTAWLSNHEKLSDKSIYDYVESGWLKRLVTGVYRRPSTENTEQPAEADWLIPLLSMQWIMNYDVHLGGESALDMAGFSHYLSLGNRSRVHLYGVAPTWLKRLPTKTKFVVHHDVLFKSPIGVTNMDADSTPAMQTSSAWQWPVKMSSPERAVLEALNELRNEADFESMDKVFEGLTSLRPKQLTALLRACRSVKVKRLFFVFADRHQHAWQKHVDMKEIDLGSGPRALVEGGKYHSKYQIYVPGNFVVRDEAETLGA